MTARLLCALGAAIMMYSCGALVTNGLYCKDECAEFYAYAVTTGFLGIMFLACFVFEVL